MWSDYKDIVPFETLLGKTLTKVEVDGDQEIVFHTAEKTYRMFHSQDCCEGVAIEDITGDLQRLIGSPLVLAEESTSDQNPKDEKYDESFTWTFYRLGTKDHTVVIRWYGTSNGYYSESVDLYCKEE